MNGPDDDDREGTDGDEAVVVHEGAPGRRPPTRRDPAAMRETLDAARRRLGSAGPTEGPPQSAAHQRALLREAVANQSVPLTGPPGPSPADPLAPVGSADPAGSAEPTPQVDAAPGDPRD